MVNFFYLDKNPEKCAKYYCDKHVNKIFIEICQLLCNVIHHNTNLIPPYKKCKNININLAPYKWAEESKSNYIYLLNLADNLCKEYKFRYNKKTHKSEVALDWLKNNIPKKFKYKNRTKLKYTKNIELFKKYFKNDIIASRYIYVIYKCKNDKWTNRNQPEWYEEMFLKSKNKKFLFKKQLIEAVKIKLPENIKQIRMLKLKDIIHF